MSIFQTAFHSRFHDRNISALSLTADRLTAQTPRPKKALSLSFSLSFAHSLSPPLLRLPPSHHSPSCLSLSFLLKTGGSVLKSMSYLIILGEQFGEFRMPPLRCFFLGDSVDGCSSSTANTCKECQTVDSWDCKVCWR